MVLAITLAPWIFTLRAGGRAGFQFRAHRGSGPDNYALGEFTDDAGFRWSLTADLSLQLLKPRARSPTILPGPGSVDPGHPIPHARRFLGFRIQSRRKRGTSKWHVYTFIADRPVRSVKDKIRALTRRTSQQPPGDVLIRLNQIMRGWANYFKHAVCKHTLESLENPRMAPGDPLVDAPAPLEVARRPPTPHRPALPVAQAVGRRDRAIQHRQGNGHPVPLPRQQDPQPLDHCITTPNGRDGGEPVAGRPARRVRRAARALPGVHVN
jgi:hypothetical protein